MKAEIEAKNAGSKAGNDEAAMAAIEDDFQANKDEVVEMLINNVLNVDVSIPRVVKGDFEDEDKPAEWYIHWSCVYI